MEKKISRSLIEEKTRTILSDRLGIDDGDIKGTSLLMDELGLDSFDALRIIFEVEDAFNIKVPPTDVFDIKTVEDVIDYIEERLSA